MDISFESSSIMCLSGELLLLWY